VEEAAAPELGEAFHHLDQRGGVGDLADAAHRVVEIDRDDDLRITGAVGPERRVDRRQSQDPSTWPEPTSSMIRSVRASMPPKNSDLPFRDACQSSDSAVFPVSPWRIASADKLFGKRL
jgi:hypothetical protein